MPEQKGKFITFEGGEGSGKTTQIRLLANELFLQGYEVDTTREPGGSEGAEEIRDLVVNGEPGRWDSWSETLLLWAARRDHVEKRIKPSLSKGTWVLCDRFIDSTLAYQGYAGGLEPGELERLQKMVIGDFVPDRTLFFSIDPAKGLARANERKQADENRFEGFDLTFHQKIHDGFTDLASKNPDRFRVIDADQSVEKVQSDVLKALELKG
jgi:dTMP kinase